MSHSIKMHKKEKSNTNPKESIHNCAIQALVAIAKLKTIYLSIVATCNIIIICFKRQSLSFFVWISNIHWIPIRMLYVMDIKWKGGLQLTRIYCDINRKCKQTNKKNRPVYSLYLNYICVQTIIELEVSANCKNIARGKKRMSNATTLSCYLNRFQLREKEKNNCAHSFCRMLTRRYHRTMWLLLDSALFRYSIQIRFVSKMQHKSPVNVM